MNILDKIVAEKRRELAEAKKRTPLSTLRAEAEKRDDFRDFKAAIQKKENVALIAEVKKASPSAGVICEDFDPATIAQQYQQGGASACSVLTDEKFFQGKLSYLRSIRESTNLPLLRKDFIIDEHQIYESVVAGADAILLIVAILDLERVKTHLDVAKRCRLAAFVEIHDESEKEIAMKAGAEIIGINNRNLKDFSVDLNTTERLAAQIRSGESRGANHKSRITIVAESGIHRKADVERLRAAGVDAVLVGESLMRGGNIEAKVKELIGA